MVGFDKEAETLVKRLKGGMSDSKSSQSSAWVTSTKRYLIVMDDMWIRGPWDDLKMAFSKNNNRSRILLTIRNREVAVHVNPYNLPHFLRFLNNDGSWEPLKRVFRKESCPQQQMVIGKQIAKECCGLPLAIVLIVGLLMKKEKTCEWWEKLAKSVISYFVSDPKQ
ncbi:hypothetical protein U1Q18_001967 [Sarracenia purpurea var. burkii]